MPTKLATKRLPIIDDACLVAPVVGHARIMLDADPARPGSRPAAGWPIEGGTSRIFLAGHDQSTRPVVHQPSLRPSKPIPMISFLHAIRPPFSGPILS